MTNMAFTLTSPALAGNERIEPDYTCDGRDAPPPLEWSHVPEGTRSLALVMDDPDAPSGTFTHWLLWDITPFDETDEPVDVSGRGVPGRNDFQAIGYRGPCPPPHHGSHRYQLRLYALDLDTLDLEEGATREELERAMDGHVIERAELVGRYQRR
jgi:hypothetical protein